MEAALSVSKFVLPCKKGHEAVAKTLPSKLAKHEFKYALLIAITVEMLQEID